MGFPPLTTGASFKISESTLYCSRIRLKQKHSLSDSLIFYPLYFCLDLLSYFFLLFFFLGGLLSLWPPFLSFSLSFVCKLRRFMQGKQNGKKKEKRRERKRSNGLQIRAAPNEQVYFAIISRRRKKTANTKFARKS